MKKNFDTEEADEQRKEHDGSLRAVEKRFRMSLRAKRSNLVSCIFKHYGIASSLTLLAMTN
jgi:hypothetical protein